MTNFLSPDARRSRQHCDTCNKWAYTSRKQARHTLKTAHKGDPDIDIYRCPTNNTIWHLGHPNKPPAGM